MENRDISDFPYVQIDPTKGYAVNAVVCCSTRVMGEPTDAPHVRGAEFHFPRFEHVPFVSVQITAEPCASPLVVYSVKVNSNRDGYTQIAIEAQTVPNGPAHGIHHCTVVATGIPLLHVQSER